MSLYAFIATKTTNDVVLPANWGNQADFNRRVRGAFAGQAGGRITVGDVKFRPVQDAVTNYVLCDGSLQPIERFPELFALLGTQFGGDGTTTFGLPDYSGALNISPVTVTQDTSGGTVNTGGTVTTPSQPGQTGGSVGGGRPSGGREPPARTDFV